MAETVYKKVIDEDGTERFEPFEQFTGFPSDGFWLVENGSKNCIHYLGEPPQPFVLNYATHIDGVAEVINRVAYGHSYTFRELAHEICAYFGQVALKEKLSKS